MVQNIDIESTEDMKFSLFLSKKDSYDALATKVAEYLSALSKTQVDPTHVRFTTVNSQTMKPRTVVKRTPTATLANILTGAGGGGYGGYGYTANQSPDSLYYEVLEMSLSDLEQRKTVKITWLSEGIVKEVRILDCQHLTTYTDFQLQDPYDILVPKQGTIGDLIPTLQKRASLPDEIIEQIRFFEAHSGKVYKMLTESYAVASINEFMTIYAERTPEEELHADRESADRAILCFNFEKEPSKYHGVPFIFLMKDGELFKDTKERLSKRTGIKGKQFDKIKFAVIRGGNGYSRPAYLDDDDVLSDKLGQDDHLGLDHVNKARNTWVKHESLNIR